MFLVIECLLRCSACLILMLTSLQALFITLSEVDRTTVSSHKALLGFVMSEGQARCRTLTTHLPNDEREKKTTLNEGAQAETQVKYPPD